MTRRTILAIGLAGALVTGGAVVLLSSFGDVARVPLTPTPGDAPGDIADAEAIAATVIEYARVRDAAAFARLSLASDVHFALADQVVAYRPAAALVDPEQWLIDPGANGFRERTGPFSALELVAASEEVAVTEGPPRTCTAPNAQAPVPPEMAAHRLISIGPVSGSIATCMHWWAVTIYLDEGGAVAGIGLDVGAP